MAQPKCDIIGEDQGLEGETENMILPITCGQTKAEFYVSKMRSGKTVGKCILFQSKWISPTEFENLSGIHSAKKWRRSIKYNGEPIGEWLANAQQDHAASSNPDKQDKQKPQELLQESQTQLDQSLPLSQNLHEVYTESPVPGTGASVSTHIPDSTGDGPYNGQLWRMIDKLCARIDGLSQEMRDQDTRHKNVTKDLRKKIQEQSERITHLENQVEAQSLITPPIPSLKAVNNHGPSGLSTDYEVSGDSDSTPPQQTYAGVTRKGANANASTPTEHQSAVTHDKKFNVVIYGVKESPKGSPRYTRQQKDTKAVTDIIKQVSPDISEHTIRDCVRLGKFSEARSRPLLVKLTRASDVQSILSNRANLSIMKGISIKEVMTHNERKVESLLLRERRSLIEAGISSKSIKLRGISLYVDRKRHGSVVDFVYKTVEPKPTNGENQVDDQSGSSEQPKSK